MALAPDEYRSGGQVFDGEGRRRIVLGGGAGLAAGEYRSGGIVVDPDGREVISAASGGMAGGNTLIQVAPPAQGATPWMWLPIDAAGVWDGTFHTYAPAPPATAPGAPTGLTATAGNGQVTLAWTAPASDGGSAITGDGVHINGAGATMIADALIAAGFAATVTATNAAPAPTA